MHQKVWIGLETLWRFPTTQLFEVKVGHSGIPIDEFTSNEIDPWGHGRNPSSFLFCLTLFFLKTIRTGEVFWLFGAFHKLQGWVFQKSSKLDSSVFPSLGFFPVKWICHLYSVLQVVQSGIRCFPTCQMFLMFGRFFFLVQWPVLCRSHFARRSTAGTQKPRSGNKFLFSVCGHCWRPKCGKNNGSLSSCSWSVGESHSSSGTLFLLYFLFAAQLYHTSEKEQALKQSVLRREQFCADLWMENIFPSRKEFSCCRLIGELSSSQGRR